MNWLKRNWKWAIVNVVAVALFGLFLGQAALAGFSAESVRHLVGSTGTVTMLFLLFSLAMTPLQIVLGWRSGQPLKKSTGLWAFAFGTMHMLYYAVEKGTLLSIFSQFYLIVGLIPLLIMLPLAVTSTNWWMRKLGKWWKPLHKTVYIAGITAGLHVALVGNPLLAGLMVLLLAVRIPAVRSWFANRQNAKWLSEGSAATRPTRHPAPRLTPKTISN